MQLNFLLMPSKILRFHLPHLRRFIKLWDDLLDLYKNNSDYCNHLLASHYSIPNNEAMELFSNVYPLYISEQIPLFCLNRYVLDVMNDIKDKILLNNNLKKLDTNENFDNMFDASLLRQITK